MFDATPMLGEFGEAITYNKGDGSQISCIAIVHRNDFQPIREISGHAFEKYMDVQLADDSVNGIDSIDPRKDSITMAIFPGGPLKDYRIRKIVDRVCGLWTLSVER